LEDISIVYAKVVMRFVLPTFATLALVPSLALAEGRHALVLGAASYDYVRDLENPAEDATAIANLLREVGFTVILETDRDARRTRRALADFAEDAEGADLALVYYAGHGVELGGVNYLLPTDTAVDTPAALAASAVPLSEVVEAVAAIAPAAILIVDACRDDPFGGTPLESAGRGAAAIDDAVTEDDRISPGFARVGRADGMVYAFATAPGDTASDGAAGHSPFAEALIRHLAKPGLDVRTVLTLVSQDVYDRTRKEQLPYFESALPDFVFVAGQPAEISERDALLLAMADLDEVTRAEVETLAVARDMPLAPLYAALLTLDPARTSREDQTRALSEAADAYAAFQQNLLTLSPTDPRVEELRAAAAADLDLGQSSAAQEKFEQAIAIDAAAIGALSEVLLPRLLSQADTLILSADAARAELNYAKAIAALTEADRVYTQAAAFGLPYEVQFKRTKSLWTLGDLHQLTGNSVPALATYRDWNSLAQALADATPDDAELQRNLSISYDKIGEILIVQGDLQAALASYSASLTIRATSAEKDHSSEAWRRALSISFDKLGDIFTAQGNLGSAVASYRAGLVVRETFVAQNPDSASWLLDRSSSYDSLGDISRAQGNLNAALAHYRAGLSIRADLVTQHPGKPVLQRYLAFSYNKIGDALSAQGNVNAALASYRAGMAIGEVLVADDPANIAWQVDLSISQNRVGDVLSAQGNLDAAMASYRNSLAIREDLIAQDSGNVGRQLRVSYSYDKIGDTLSTRGNLDDAFASYSAGLSIRKALVAKDPANATWQVDLATSYDKIGDTLSTQGNLHAALASYRESFAIRKVLVFLDSSNAQWQGDLTISHDKIADTLFAQGDLEAAMASYNAGLAIAEVLASMDPSNTEWQRNLSISYAQIADVLIAQGNIDAAVAQYRKDLAIAQRLTELDPSNIEWQRDLSISHDQIATILLTQGNLEGAIASFRSSLAIAEVLAAVDGSVQAQLDLVSTRSGLAILSTDPRPDLESSLAILLNLQSEGRLPAEHENWITMIEFALAALPPP